jgi:hypothetical protein
MASAPGFRKLEIGVSEVPEAWRRDGLIAARSPDHAPGRQFMAPGTNPCAKTPSRHPVDFVVFLLFFIGESRAGRPSVLRTGNEPWHRSQLYLADPPGVDEGC